MNTQQLAKAKKGSLAMSNATLAGKPAAGNQLAGASMNPSHVSLLKAKLLACSLFLLPFVPAFGYTFGTSRHAASTEIFGYDRATLPETGSELRTDAFITLTNKVGTNTFHLDDLRVLGYDRTIGSAGTFKFRVLIKKGDGDIVTDRDDKDRELVFYWYDTPSPLREPGWYDSDGLTRWENLSFAAGQAFAFEGGGLVLETNGLVLDTAAKIDLPSNTSVALGNCWAKSINLCDMTITGNGTKNIAGGITLETLSNDLSRASCYYWYNVTNNAIAAAYRVPGWYASTSKKSKYTPESGVTFDMGKAFWLKGFQTASSESAVNTVLSYPKLALNVAERDDVQDWSSGDKGQTSSTTSSSFTFIGRAVDGSHLAYPVGMFSEVRAYTNEGGVRTLIATSTTFSPDDSAYHFRIDIPVSTEATEGSVLPNAKIAFEFVDKGGNIIDGVVPEDDAIVGEPGGAKNVSVMLGKDANKNGVSDEMELVYWWYAYGKMDSRLTGFDGDGDCDGDGMSNRDEYIAGTNPFVASDDFNVRKFVDFWPKDDDGNQLYDWVKVSFEPKEGRCYTLLTTTSLEDGSKWMPGEFKYQPTAEAASHSCFLTNRDEPCAIRTFYIPKDVARRFWRITVE